jgi:hypothetical protein
MSKSMQEIITLNRMLNITNRMFNILYYNYFYYLVPDLLISMLTRIVEVL